MALLVALAACSGERGTPVGAAEPRTDDEPTSPEGPVTPVVPEDVALTVQVDGTGFVRSEPAGIECPGKCSARFATGTEVMLVPAPAEGWRVETCASCAITLDRDTTVTVTLALIDPRWDPSVGAADCAAAWGVAGEKLSPCDKQKDDYVVVRKSTRNTALCASGKLVKNFRSGLGFAPVGSKERQGDGRTPEGVFYVPRMLPDSDHHRALLLSYPRKEDAARGVAGGLITSAQRNQIVTAHDACKEPPQGTPLGGLVELHGEGSRTDWTAGSVALDNDDMDVVWVALHTGDTIVVVP